MVLGEASEATVHGGTVRWRGDGDGDGEGDGDGVVLWERRGRRGEVPMCCTATVTDCTVHRVRLTLVTRTRRLAWTSVRRRVLSLHYEDRMNSILTIKCTTVVLLLLLVGT